MEIYSPPTILDSLLHPSNLLASFTYLAGVILLFRLKRQQPAPATSGFVFQASDSNGAMIEDTLRAENEEQALKILKEKGFFVSRIKASHDLVERRSNSRHFVLVVVMSIYAGYGIVSILFRDRHRTFGELFGVWLLYPIEQIALSAAFLATVLLFLRPKKRNGTPARRQKTGYVGLDLD